MNPRVDQLFDHAEHVISARLAALGYREKSLEPLSRADIRALVLDNLAAARRLYRATRRQPREKQINLNDLPGGLRRLIKGYLDAIRDSLPDLRPAEVEKWLRDMAKLIAQYFGAAWMSGQDSPDLDAGEVEQVIDQVQAEVGFLRKFALEVQGAEEFQAGWEKRAESYANGIKAPYWSGKTKVLPLPAMPGDGTSQCLTNCRCKWEVRTLDEGAGNWDAYWRLGQADHCQTCIERARQWAPLRIRDGVLQD